MESPTQPSSQEDHVGSSLRFTTPREMSAWVETHADALGSEWLMSLCLGPHGEILGTHTLFHGDRCGINPEPYLPAMIAHATSLPTTALLTIRRHSHRWTGPSHRSQAHLDVLAQQVHDAGIRLLGSLVQDSKGRIHTLVFDQTEGSVGGKSGSSGPISRPR